MKMRQDLGKILLTLLFSVSLFAGVSAKVDQNAVYRGDNVNLTITAEGGDAEFPNIYEIDSFPVTGTSTARSTNIINGDITSSVSHTYSFSPTRDVIIPSYELTVDGERELTKAIPVRVIKPTASTAGADFIAELSLDKKEAYVGESVRFDIKFKRRLGAKADKVQINEPALKGFWAKKVEEESQSSEGEYIVETHTYLLFPQQEGNLTIPALEVAVGTLKQRRNNGFFNDPFFSRMTNQLQWQKSFSNAVSLNVKPLPSGLELYGSFSIGADVDKASVRANKPVNLTITVTGEGNVEDIIKFDPLIDDVIIYADEPQTRSKLINGKYVGSFKQKIAIIGDKDFVIPALDLRYFDKDQKRVITKKTEPIAIKVTGSTVTTTEPKIEKSTAIIESERETPTESTPAQTQQEDSTTKYLYLFIGVVLGVLGTYAGMNYRRKVGTKKEDDLLRAIEKAKDDRTLFDLLLPFGNIDPVIDDALIRLEANLYGKEKNSIDKEKLLECFEEHAELLGQGVVKS